MNEYVTILLALVPSACMVYITLNIVKRLEATAYVTQEEFCSLCEELTQIKALYKKHHTVLRNVVRSLPFKGEEWRQEFIREDIDEFMQDEETTEDM